MTFMASKPTLCCDLIMNKPVPVQKRELSKYRHTMMQNIDPALANMDLIYSIDPNRGRTKCCPEIQSKCRC